MTLPAEWRCPDTLAEITRRTNVAGATRVLAWLVVGLVALVLLRRAEWQ